MRTPTEQQKGVLDNTARVRIVRAAPGSGKTWLVAELIREELKSWPRGSRGIAALSFTRVGGEEIRKAVGYQLDHPHFVGTIDAFLFRYVLRPHLRQAFPMFAQPRLVPGDWGAKYWAKMSPTMSATVGNGKRQISLLDCVCIGEENGGKAVFAYKPHPMQPLRRLEGADLEAVKEGKKQMWQGPGLLTHSDAALLASRILDHSRIGAAVRAEIVRRFPLLIVDELQDTGHFLGRCISLLLQEPRGRGVLVGDPDQAIFEFNGARPDLFNGFEGLSGAAVLPLSATLRCPSSITAVAGQLKEAAGPLEPVPGATGRAILVRYDDMVVDVRRVVDALTNVSKKADVLKVVARAGATVEELAGRSVEWAPSLHCRPLTHIHRSVVAFRQNRNVRALASARAAIDVLFFDHECVDDQELQAGMIEPDEWKRLAVRCLLAANGVASEGSIWEWQQQVGRAVDSAIVSMGVGRRLCYKGGRLVPQKRKGWDKPAAAYLPSPGTHTPGLSGVPVQTVHAVKGETHDATVFVCPPVKQEDRCPSSVWWSEIDADQEERRIAFVAMTRSRKDLVLCIPNECYLRLKDRRASFVQVLQCLSVDEFVAELSEVHGGGIQGPTAPQGPNPRDPTS